MSLQTGFRVVFIRECKRIISSKICIWGMIIAPLLTFAILMYMMSAGLPTKIPVAVVDLDNSSTSRALVRQLDAFAKTDIKFKSLSFKEARIAMERAEVYGIFTIPEDFAKDAVSGNRPKIVFYTNNAFLISGSLLFQDMKMISVLASASVKPFAIASSYTAFFVPVAVKGLIASSLELLFLLAINALPLIICH